MDYKEAVKWHRASAEQGESVGKSNLTFMYAHGQGVKRDLGEAAKWYQQAAESACPARERLAQLHEKGQGVPLDYVMAYFWYARTVSGGHEASKRAMALVIAEGDLKTVRGRSKRTLKSCKSSAR